MRDREYLQEMAYIQAEKEERERQELLDLQELKPAKIIILSKLPEKDEYKTRSNTLAVSRNSKEGI